MFANILKYLGQNRRIISGLAFTALSYPVSCWNIENTINNKYRSVNISYPNVSFEKFLFRKSCIGHSFECDDHHFVYPYHMCICNSEDRYNLYLKNMTAKERDEYKQEYDNNMKIRKDLLNKIDESKYIPQMVGCVTGGICGFIGSRIGLCWLVFMMLLAES